MWDPYGTGSKCPETSHPAGLPLVLVQSPTTCTVRARRLPPDPRSRGFTPPGSRVRSENELCDDPCQAVRVGLELQGVPRALASEECFDRAASEPTKLPDKDQELSDLGGATTTRLCNHHSQLYMLSCQGRKCSVVSCFGSAHGGHRGVMYCRKHLAETARSQSPAGPALSRGSKSDASLAPSLRKSMSPKRTQESKLVKNTPDKKNPFSPPTIPGNMGHPFLWRLKPYPAGETKGTGTFSALYWQGSLLS